MRLPRRARTLSRHSHAPDINEGDDEDGDRRASADLELVGDADREHNEKNAADRPCLSGSSPSAPFTPMGERMR